MKSKNVFSSNPYKVEPMKVKEGEPAAFFTDTPLILFNCSPHTVYMNWGEKETKKIEQEEMIFLFPGFSCSFHSEKESEVFLFYIPDASRFYYQYIQTYVSRKKAAKEIIHSLPIKKVIREFIDYLIIYEKDQITNEELLRIKSAELFILLKHSYRLDKLSSFFSPVLSPEKHFMALVLSFEIEVRTVEELAEKCNLSLPVFYRMFVDIFEVSPYKWMRKRKIKRVYEHIYETSYPLKEVADEVGFTSLSQMVDYCKKHIGMTPGEIRRKRNPHVDMN